MPYRGRLAPSPTGLLHLGHARTFWTAFESARAANGVLVLRNEDLDRSRSRPEFVTAFLDDLRWFGIQWQEGPDCGGPFGPYSQNERLDHYRAAFRRLRDQGDLFSCACSRKDIQSALTAPHATEDEPIYPGTCRHREIPASLSPKSTPHAPRSTLRHNWRFRVPDGEVIRFIDGRLGPQAFVAGRDFGDFIVWRHDDLPSYQLACVVDDVAMAITEVVRGADLLVSTARQLLLYRALGWTPPVFFHTSLMTDARGIRLAKRHDALSLRTLRQAGKSPEELRRAYTDACLPLAGRNDLAHGAG